VAHQFVSSCPNCGRQFAILWVMNSTQRVDPEMVARIACPLCGRRFCQNAKGLPQIGSQMQNLLPGRPVRSVEVAYDCSHCSNRGILVSLPHTDLSWDEMSLSKEHVRTAVCDRELCSQRGLLQKLKPSRVPLGSLNPVDIGFFPLRLETSPTRWGRPFKRIIKFGGQRRVEQIPPSSAA
jgi:DNA-directed RNA polymerase subunit RPC12/RpoP